MIANDGRYGRKANKADDNVCECCNVWTKRGWVEATMQGWLEDAFAHQVGDLDYLTDMEIRSRVQIHYDGGLRQFRKDA